MTAPSKADECELLLKESKVQELHNRGKKSKKECEWGWDEWVILAMSIAKIKRLRWEGKRGTTFTKVETDRRLRLTLVPLLFLFPLITPSWKVADGSDSIQWQGATRVGFMETCTCTRTCKRYFLHCSRTGTGSIVFVRWAESYVVSRDSCGESGRRQIWASVDANWMVQSEGWVARSPRKM